MKNIKHLIVQEIVAELKNVKSGVIFNYQGLSAEEISQLRKSLREKNIRMAVYKNSLFQIALKELDLGVENVDSLSEEIFNLPTAVIYSDKIPEPVETAKAFTDWQKAQQKTDVKIKGGFYGKKMLTSSEVRQYATMPPKEVLIAQVVSGIASPLTSFINTLNAMISNFVLVVKAIQDKKEKETEGAK